MQEASILTGAFLQLRIQESNSFFWLQIKMFSGLVVRNNIKPFVIQLDNDLQQIMSKNLKP